jgi:hypothetical protein
MSSLKEKMLRNRGNRIIRGNCTYSYVLIINIVVVLNMVGVAVDGFSLNSQSQVEQSSPQPREQVKLSMRRRQSPSTNNNDNKMNGSNHIISIEFKEPRSRKPSTAKARKYPNPATYKNAKTRTNSVQAGPQLQIPFRQAPKQANSVVHSKMTKMTKKVSKKASRKVVEESASRKVVQETSLPTSVSGSVPPSRRQPTTPVRMFDSRRSGNLTQHHSSKNVFLPLEKLAIVLESDSHSDSESHLQQPDSDYHSDSDFQQSSQHFSSIEHSNDSIQQRKTRIANAKNAKKRRDHHGSEITRARPRDLRVNQYTSEYESSREAYERVRAALQALRGTPQEMRGSADWFSGRRPAELAGILQGFTFSNRHSK